MSRQLTLAVVGHVDHGKTALVRALTGVNTDRLKEEQERGLSIVLGFSYMEHSGGGIIDFIDAPGHENFLRTMISGVTGVDAALLVVAANEGVMAQTREHLEICQLLGIDRGVVVINKKDLVSPAKLDAVTRAVRELIADTFLEKAAFTYTSATDGDGVECLRTALEALESGKGHLECNSEHYLLPIDRSFVMKGFGSVVTGTLRGGILRADRRVELMPHGLISSVRGIQVHNRPVDEAKPGQRVAVNLRNIKKGVLRRGDTLSPPGVLQPTRSIDTEVELLAGQPNALKNGTNVRLLIGTSEVMARVHLLDCGQLEPGTVGLVQLRLDRPITTYEADRFIIRSYSPLRTIGGGRLLDAHASRHRRFDEAVTARLSAAAHGTPAELVKERLKAAWLQGIDLETIGKSVDLDKVSLIGILESVSAVRLGGPKFVDAAALSELKTRIVEAVHRYHEMHPRQQGAAAAGIHSQLAPDIDKDVFEAAVDSLIVEGNLQREHDSLRLPAFDPLARLSERNHVLAKQLEEAALDAGMLGLELEQMIGRDNLKRELVLLLTETGRLVKLRTYDRKRNLVMHQQTLENVTKQLYEHFSDSCGFAASEVRDVLGSTRRFVLPLLEHLDSTGVTVRVNDMRHLRRR